MQEPPQQNRSIINQLIFNQNIKDIHEKSNELGDNWNIFQSSSDIFYLEKIEQKLNDEGNDIYTFTYHVLFSEPFSVPVFYFNVFKSNGKILTYDELYSCFKINSEKIIISQQDHPIFCKPFYFLHPCFTSDWMESSIINECLPSNFTLKWLSFVLSGLKIQLNLKYAFK
jgi:ubiquitin-like-conjugating enzyme ATG10